MYTEKSLSETCQIITNLGCNYKTCLHNIVNTIHYTFPTELAPMKVRLETKHS